MGVFSPKLEAAPHCPHLLDFSPKNPACQRLPAHPYFPDEETESKEGGELPKVMHRKLVGGQGWLTDACWEPSL